jgi:hypothetical protein
MVRNIRLLGVASETIRIPTEVKAYIYPGAGGFAFHLVMGSNRMHRIPQDGSIAWPVAFTIPPEVLQGTELHVDNGTGVLVFLE